jgi:hypothetical protein
VRSPEHDLQRAYFDWARLHPVARRAFAIPNGGHRSKATAGRLKAEGVRAGVLDIMLPVPVGQAHGLWIEMKAGYNTLSPEQAQEVDALVADGYIVAVAWDAVKAIEFTLEYLSGDAPPGLTLLKPARKPTAAAA